MVELGNKGNGIGLSKWDISANAESNVLSFPSAGGEGRSLFSFLSSLFNPPSSILRIPLPGIAVSMKIFMSIQDVFTKFDNFCYFMYKLHRIWRYS